MQRPDDCARTLDAKALGRGISGLTEHFAKQAPDFVLVLGDRIEAFAAASAAAVSGIRVAHMHGGDRAEGIADESLRHAISKLAHLHLPATESSANRLIAMGEEPARVHVVGSPAIDDLASMPALSDAEFAELGSPRIVGLLHPTGDDESIEHDRAARLLDHCRAAGATLALHPNHDPGRGGIVLAIEESKLPSRAHLPRAKFIGLLRRVKVLVGNSSAGLIEAAALPTWCVNVGRRQSGRERADNVIDIENWDYQTIEMAIRRALTDPLSAIAHPYGDGRTGQRVADLLASIPLESLPLRKRNTY
jgi:UDP-hydrolysing UDP-N-acetyl-D-glucosamine 2-epimerase